MVAVDVINKIHDPFLGRYRPKNETTAEALIKGDDVTLEELVRYLTDQSNPSRLENIHWIPVRADHILNRGLMFRLVTKCIGSCALPLHKTSEQQRRNGMNILSSVGDRRSTTCADRARWTTRSSAR